MRGSNFNYGDGLKMALDIGAMPWGHWGGCHATPINAEAPDYGGRDLTDKTNRLSYPYGVMLNVEGKRWIDEGADFNSYTYAKYGGLILKQPNSLVYQIFDSKVLRPARAALFDQRAVQVRHARRARQAAQGRSQAGAEDAQRIQRGGGRGGPFNPAVLDGMHTEGIEPPKTNWAQKLDTPPYVSYPVTGGITFTFGGLKITKDAQVVASDWKPMPGLYVRRNGGRTVPLQLSARHRPDVGRGVRPHCRDAARRFGARTRPWPLPCPAGPG